MGARRYAIACFCGGESLPLAVITDARPDCPEIDIRRGAMTTGRRRQDLAGNLGDIEPNAIKFIANKTFWVVECKACQDRAQLNRKNLIRLADHLAQDESLLRAPSKAILLGAGLGVLSYAKPRPGMTKDQLRRSELSRMLVEAKPVLVGVLPLKTLTAALTGKQKK